MVLAHPIVSQQGGCDLAKQEVNLVNFLTERGGIEESINLFYLHLLLFI